MILFFVKPKKCLQALFFLKYLFLPNVFKSKIDFFPDIYNLNHLDIFKNCFKSGFLISQESQIQYLLCFSPILSNVIQVENENLKLKSTLSSLPELIPSPLHSDINEGMNLLRQNCKDIQYQIRAFYLFKHLADTGDPEAAWRVAACYSVGCGVETNNQQVKIYSQIAIDYDIPEGYFWFWNFSSNYKLKEISYLKESSDRNL